MTPTKETVWRSLPSLFKDTYVAWNEDKAPRLGAALAYYTVFSMAPLLIVILAIAGIIFDRVGGDSRHQILQQIYGTFGESGGKLVENMINNANHQNSGIIATIIGFATLLLGAGGLFGQLQDALNTIWGVAPKPGLGFMAMLRARFLSFTMVLGTAFLLLVSLALSALIQVLTDYMGGVLPMPEFVIQLLHFVISFGIITLLFAMIFKVLPDAEIQWHDVWVGAAVTSLLFVIGKLALSIYLSRSAPGSTYGEAGSLVLILLWVYYAAQILFFGAEFTQVFATKFGSRIEPSPYAVALTGDALARQGIPRNDMVEAAAKTQAYEKEKQENPALLTDADENVSLPSPASTTSPRHASEPDWGFLGATLAGFVAVLSIAGMRNRRREARLQKKRRALENNVH
jgi:membrane protein